MSARRSRLTALLLAFTDGQGPVTCNTLVKRTGWTSRDASGALSNAKMASLVVVSKEGTNGNAEHALTELGRKKLESFGLAEAKPAKSLGERALDLVEKSTAGLNSGDLADALETTAEAVEEALGAHVVSRRLVSCAVKNAMGDFTHYRVSSGLAQADLANAHWKKSTVTPLPARPAPGTVHKLAAADGLDIDAVHRTANTVDMEPVAARLEEAMDEASLPPAMRAAGPSLEEQARESQQAFTAAVDAGADKLAAFPTPSGSFGTVTHMQLVDATDDAPCCFVDSLGRLRIEHGGEELRFTRSETLGLLRYLTHIDALGLVESIAREAA